MEVEGQMEDQICSPRNEFASIPETEEPKVDQYVLVCVVFCMCVLLNFDVIFLFVLCSVCGRVWVPAKSHLAGGSWCSL